MIREEPRWNKRPWLSWIIRVAVFLIPVLAAAGAAIAVGKLFPSPDTFPGVLFWWAGLVLMIVLVLITFDRLVRRLLPLAALMRLTLAFPDRAPSRAKVLRLSGSLRRLEEQRDAAAVSGHTEVANAAEHILTLAAALNEHDRLTRGHGERVRVFTDMIAEEMEIPPSDQDRLRWVALLHDVGKLAIDQEILNSPDRPTEEQWAILRSHPEEGAKLIAPIREWLGSWAATVEQHHEKYDGTGYPGGLSGEEIALGARIVAVADAYDVITAARSYKRPISAEAARRELATSAGGHFDPKVVRALLNVSLGRLRVAIGPGAWVAQIPILGALEQFSRQVGVVGATVAIIAALFGFGIIDAPEASASISSDATSTVADGGDDGSGSAGADGGNGSSASSDGDVGAVAEPQDEPSTTSTTSTTLPSTTTSSSITTTTTTSTSTTTTMAPTTTTVPIVTTTTVPQHSPVAGADLIVTFEDTAIVINVLANDTDADGDALSVRSADAESEAGGAIDCTAVACTYKPPDDFNGPDTFSYVLSDATGRSDIGLVEVEVTPVNDPPIARNDVYPANFADVGLDDRPIPAGATRLLSVLWNDSDPEGEGLAIVAVDVSSTAGAVVWTSNSIIYRAPDAFTGTDTITYSISDPGGLSSTATVVVNIAGP